MTSSTDPRDYPERVLLIVTGLTPQVVTETVYALAVAAPAEERYTPTRIELVSTQQGAQGARMALLPDGGRGWLDRLCRDYGLPSIQFGMEQIHCIHDPDGRPIPDIRTPADNRALADTLTQLVRHITLDTDTALHVSIAGGRKTMGFYAGYALSLFGRVQDRLSHVLVSAPFESSQGFFYPTPRSEIIEVGASQQLADAKDATVTLADIPYVSLRHGLPNDLLEGRSSYHATVEAARRAFRKSELALHRRSCRIEANSIALELTSWEFALYAYLLLRAHQQQAPLALPGKEIRDLAWGQDMASTLDAQLGENWRTVKIEDQLEKGVEGQLLSSHLSRVRRKLMKTLGQAALPFLFDQRERKVYRYGLTLPADAIRLTDD